MSFARSHPWEIARCREDHRHAEQHGEHRADTHDEEQPALHRHEALQTRGIGGDRVVDVQPRQVEQPGEPGHHEHHV